MEVSKQTPFQQKLRFFRIVPSISNDKIRSLILHTLHLKVHSFQGLLTFFINTFTFNPIFLVVVIFEYSSGCKTFPLNESFVWFIPSNND